MDQLSTIFENPDPAIRKAELSKLAKSLNINTAKSKNEKGEVDENRLAVLIYEELQEGGRKRQQRTMLVVLAIIFFIVSTIGMYFISRALLTMTKASSEMNVTEEGE